MIAKANENRVVIRFPKTVLEAVTDSARRNGRSRNSEVIVLLAKSLGVETNEASSAPMGESVEKV